MNTATQTETPAAKNFRLTVGKVDGNDFEVMFGHEFSALVALENLAADPSVNAAIVHEILDGAGLVRRVGGWTEESRPTVSSGDLFVVTVTEIAGRVTVLVVANGTAEHARRMGAAILGYGSPRECAKVSAKLAA